MRRYLNGAFLAMVLSVFLVFTLPSSANAVGAMSFWGDSSTDNGNVLALLLRSFSELKATDLPQITNGRLTNGPNWADYVTSAFAQSTEASLLGGNNYAYAGALMGQGSALVPAVPLEFYVPNVGSVINAYLSKGVTFTAEDVVFLFAGHNDALRIETMGVMADPYAVAQDLRNNLEKLYSAGARIFVVPTLVAVESAPEVVRYGFQEIIGSWIAVYEEEAAKTIAAFMADHPDAAVLVPDLGELTRKIIANPGKYGFTNVTDAGFDEATNQALTGADNYLWWDVHVTTKAQRLFAQEVLGAMGDYYYPEQMVPQAAAASMQVNRILAQQAMKRASLRLRQCDLSAEDQEVNQIYAVPFFSWGSQDGEAMAMGFDWTARGMDIGFQRRLSPAITAGLNLDIHEADANCDDGGGDATINGLGITPFAVFMRENWRVHGGARYSRADTSADRPLWMTGTTARANYYAESWGAWAEVDHDFRLADGVTLMPLLNVNWVHMVEVGVDESGAYLLNSYLELGDYNSLRHLLGATLAVWSDTGWSEGLRLQLTAGWRHEYLDTQTRSSAELAATTRVLDGPDSGGDALAVDLQVSCPLPWGMALELAYTGDYSQNANIQSVLLWIVASF